MFKLEVAEKIKRVKFLKDVSATCFKLSKYDKAEKIYTRINAFFKGKDAKNNF